MMSESERTAQTTTMRGTQNFQGAVFSDISLEERVPQAHPLSRLHAVVCALLATMNREFEAVYARRGRPSVPPEMLLKALLLQILFSIRSERQLVEAIDYKLLYRWCVGLNIEDTVWDHSTFSANRERLFNEELARVCFEWVKSTAEWAKLTSDKHFSVDGTQIEAQASHKSFKRKDDDSKAFIAGSRKLKVTPHVAAKDKHSAADGRIERQARLCCATPTWYAWGRLAAGGTHIMHNSWDRCARNGQNGLQTGRNGRSDRCADPFGRPASSKPTTLALYIGFFRRPATVR